MIKKTSELFTYWKSVFKFLSTANNPKVRTSSQFREMTLPFRYEPFEEALWYSIDYVSTIKLDGDYLEFGVWQGRTFSTAYHFAQDFNLENMRFYVFDSFEGLPEVKGIDTFNQEYQQGDYQCSLKEFKNILNQNEVNLNKVDFIEGFYEESLTQENKEKLGIKQAAVIMIDCDLYTSTKEALEFCTDYIVSGTVIIFEDWFCFRNSPNHGEQKAFREWLKNNPQFEASDFSIHPTLKAFVMYKKEESIEQKNSTVFHAKSLDTLISSGYCDIGRENDGKEGCLVCGPSQPIELNKRWRVELCYSSSHCKDELVGDFDILLNIGGEDMHAASCQIFGTDNQVIRVPLEFKVDSKHHDGLIQTRVFTVENKSLTSYFFELKEEY